MWRVVAFLLVAVVGVPQSAASSFFLPGDVRPVHYDLRAFYDLDPASNFSYFAVVDILLKAHFATSKIILHAQDYTISEKDVKITGPTPTEVLTVHLNDTYNFLTITLDKKLDTDGNYTLTIPFHGNLKPGLDGVYISSYVNKQSKMKEYLIATQFEAISARKGFPCFDEPIYKATYKITLGHSRQFSAVSNMPLKKSTDQNVMESQWPWFYMVQRIKKERTDFVWDTFEDSVPMSTYLVAWVISKFSHADSPPALSKTKFRIWARSDAIEQTKYASVIGPRVLTYFEKFFNVTFPLPKQDMIAIPDFSAGAMENWGLITYRETALLYDSQQSSFLNKERVAEVIAHELAHQWFGNLVTMKWWSDLWLNEGFATFTASVGVAAVEPEWRADRNYAVDNIMSVLNLDALESSHPVSVPIDDPKRINEIFDEISYRKGSTLIRMMTMFLGEDVFRTAIHNYLVKFSYQNAGQDDLWRELTLAARTHKPPGPPLPPRAAVKQIMDTWTTRTGYPLLTVTRDYQDGSLTVTQKRYLSLSARSTNTASWWVPLSVLCEPEAVVLTDSDGADHHEEDALRENGAGLQWLADDEGVNSLHRFEHGSRPEEWVLFNYDMIAPYRVNYDKRNWQLLSNALASEQFRRVPVLGRVQLVSDAFALAWTNRLPYETTLKLASYLSRETEYLPLSTGLSALFKIENVLKRAPDYGAFQKFVRKLIGDTYVSAGGLAAKKIVNGDNLNSVKMQVMTSQWACRMKVPGCEEAAIQLFKDWMEAPNPDSNNPIPLDLRRTVYCVAISRGSVLEWRFALARLQRANVAAARDQLLASLACTREPWVLSQFLEWSISDGSVVRRQDAAAALSAAARSHVGYYVAKNFVYNRIADIYKAFNGQSRRLGYLIKTLLDQFTLQSELDEFLKWHETNKKYLEDAKLAVKQAIEKASVNIDWVNRNKKMVVDKLRELTA